MLCFTARSVDREKEKEIKPWLYLEGMYLSALKIYEVGELLFQHPMQTQTGKVTIILMLSPTPYE